MHTISCFVRSKSYICIRNEEMIVVGTSPRCKYAGIYSLRLKQGEDCVDFYVSLRNVEGILYYLIRYF